MTIRIHPHAQERMRERGATEEEVLETVKKEKGFPPNLGGLDLDTTFPLEKRGGGKFIERNKLKHFVQERKMSGW